MHCIFTSVCIDTEKNYVHTQHTNSDIWMQQKRSWKNTNTETSTKRVQLMFIFSFMPMLWNLLFKVNLSILYCRFLRSLLLQRHNSWPSRSVPQTTFHTQCSTLSSTITTATNEKNNIRSRVEFSDKNYFVSLFSFEKFHFESINVLPISFNVIRASNAYHSECGSLSDCEMTRIMMEK